jgi:hypothetical protein
LLLERKPAHSIPSVLIAAASAGMVGTWQESLASAMADGTADAWRISETVAARTYHYTNISPSNKALARTP